MKLYSFSMEVRVLDLTSLDDFLDWMCQKDENGGFWSEDLPEDEEENFEEEFDDYGN
jgi:hypothetical protein